MYKRQIVEDDTGYRSQLGKYIDQYQSDFSETVSVSEFSDGLEIVEKYKSEYEMCIRDRAGFLSGAFEIFGCKKKMLDYGSRHTTPVTLGTAIGMTWAAAFEKDGSVLKRAWVIGPVFYQDVSLRGIEQGLQYYNRLETSVAWTMQLYEALKTVPVLQCTVLHRYALMM